MTDRCCCRTDRWRPPGSQSNADEDGDQRRDQDIDPGFLGDSFAEFGCQDGNDQDRQWAAGSTELV